MKIIANITTKATDLTKAFRSIKKKYSKDYKIAVIEVKDKVSISIYYANSGDDFKGFDGKYPNQQPVKFVSGDKLISLIPNSSPLTKDIGSFVFDPERNAWGKIPKGYYKKLITNSDIRESLIEKVIDKKELDKQQQILDQQNQLVELYAEYNNEVKKMFGSIPSTRFSPSLYMPKEGQASPAIISFKEWQDWDMATPTTNVYYRTNLDYVTRNEDHRIEVSFSTGGIKNEDDKKELLKIIDEVDKIQNALNKFFPNLNKLGDKIKDLEIKQIH